MAAASLTVHAAALGRPSGQTTCSGCGSSSLQPSPRRKKSHPAAVAVGSASPSGSARPSSSSSLCPSSSLFPSSRAMLILQQCGCASPLPSAASSSACSPACHHRTPSSASCASSWLPVTSPPSGRSRGGAVCSYVDFYRRPFTTWATTGGRGSGSRPQLLVPLLPRHGGAAIRRDTLNLTTRIQKSTEAIAMAAPAPAALVAPRILTPLMSEYHGNVNGSTRGMASTGIGNSRRGISSSASSSNKCSRSRTRTAARGGEDGGRRRRRWTPTILRCMGSDEGSGGAGGDTGVDGVDSSSSSSASSSSSSTSSPPNSITTTTATTTTAAATEVSDKEKEEAAVSSSTTTGSIGGDSPQLPLAPLSGTDSLSSSSSHGEEEKLRLDAFSVMELLGPEKVDSEDVKLLKERVFGYTTFWVTKQEPYGDFGEGVLLMGNLRGKREEVYEKLQKSLKELMGEKYDLFMVEEPNAENPDPRGGPRVSFVVLRKEVSQTGPTTFWQYLLAVGLFFLTAGACLELGLASQVSRLPEDIVRYFASPDPQNMATPDVSVLAPFVDRALPVAYAVFGVQLIHEAGHWAAAIPRKVRLGIPYFIPNITIGSFGAITQFTSICPDRSSKFDVSIAGPIAGGALSLGIFAYGLALSVSPSSPDDLIQVPSLLFQGSLALGTACRAVLGFDAVHAPFVAIHPLVVAGWCGLTTTALNLLPVGCLDGGRAVQAAFGKGVLQVSSIITYIMLGLSLLGGTLSLPWGLYVLIVQRSQEKASLNDVTEVGALRQGVLIFLLLLSALILLPVLPPIAEDLGIGPTQMDPFL